MRNVQFSAWKSTIDVRVFFDKVVKNGTLLQPYKAECIAGYGSLVGSPTVSQYRSENVLKHVEMEDTVCKDSKWMKSNSYYPNGKLNAHIYL